MTLVRVGWGAVAAVWALTLLPDIDPFLTDGALRYERSLPDGAWNLLGHTGGNGAALATCGLLVVASLATMVGWRTRASAAVAVLCMIVLQRGSTIVLNSGDLLLRQIGIAVVLAPAGVLWSLDARRARRQGRAVELLRAPWAMRLLQLELAIGYLLSAWTKTRGDTWHNGNAVARSLRIEDLQRFAVPGWLFEQSVLLNLFTWAALAFEALFIVIVWPRRTRLWVLGAGVLFHLGIDVFLDIGFFSIAIYLAYLAFLPDDVADRVVARLWGRPRAPAHRAPTSDPNPSFATGWPGGPASRAGRRWRAGRDEGGARHRS
jgi:hypothetical protein